MNSASTLYLLKEEYNLLMRYADGPNPFTVGEKGSASNLLHELSRAEIVEKDAMPLDVIRLNSKIKIKDEGTGKITELVLVLPESADIKQRKISVLAPIGTALIGFKKGQQVTWDVPAGTKTFQIIEVVND